MAGNAVNVFLDTERVVVPQMWLENHSVEDVRMQVQWAVATYYLQNNPERFVTVSGLFPQGYLAVNEGVHHFMMELDFHTWYNTRFGDEGIHQPMDVEVAVEVQIAAEDTLPGPAIRDEYGNMLEYDEMQVRLEPSDVPGYVMFKENIIIPKAWADLYSQRLIKRVILLTIGQAHMNNLEEPIYIMLFPDVMFWYYDGVYWFLTEADYQECQRSAEMAAEVEQQQQQQQEDLMMEYQSEDDSGFGSSIDGDDNDDSGLGSTDSEETLSITSEITDSDYSEIMEMDREE